MSVEQPYREQRKIDPTLGEKLNDGLPNNDNRIEIGPTQLAYSEWAAVGLTLPDLGAMREYRWQRLTQHIVCLLYTSPSPRD